MDWGWGTGGKLKFSLQAAPPVAPWFGWSDGIGGIGRSDRGVMEKRRAG